MKSLKFGKNTFVSVENITPFGIWMLIKDKEYFLTYEQFPFFKDQSIGSIQHVKLEHEFHLYWPDLDIDLHLDNLIHPEKYHLQSKVKK